MVNNHINRFKKNPYRYLTEMELDAYKEDDSPRLDIKELKIIRPLAFLNEVS